MKFLIQKIHNQIRHDFSFTLIESARFYNWFNHNSRITLRYLNTTEGEPSFNFKDYHYKQKYIPIGSVEFVSQYLYRFYGLIPKPINVPEELFHYAGRRILNGTDKSLKKLRGDYVVKSNTHIKGFNEIIGCSSSGNQFPQSVPFGYYQISEFIPNIISEWRAFVYAGDLVGLQNYSGDFTKWPNINTIKGMIGNYKSAPIAYTLDVAISEDRGTFLIECHDFFSCGLYGFSNHKILPYMFYKWFRQYIERAK